MMKRRIYADTSVIGGCVDAEFEKASQLLMETTEDAVVLANLYIDAGAIGAKNRADAQHIAVATVSRVGVLVSWNFRPPGGN